MESDVEVSPDAKRGSVQIMGSGLRHLRAVREPCDQKIDASEFQVCERSQDKSTEFN